MTQHKESWGQTTDLEHHSQTPLNLCLDSSMFPFQQRTMPFCRGVNLSGLVLRFNDQLPSAVGACPIDPVCLSRAIEGLRADFPWKIAAGLARWTCLFHPLQPDMGFNAWYVHLRL